MRISTTDALYFAFGIFFLLLTSLQKQEIFISFNHKTKENVSWNKDKFQLENVFTRYKFKKKVDLAIQTNLWLLWRSPLKVRMSLITRQTGLVLWVVLDHSTVCVRQSPKPHFFLLISVEQIHWWWSRTSWACQQQEGKHAFKQIEAFRFTQKQPQ